MWGLWGPGVDAAGGRPARRQPRCGKLLTPDVCLGAVLGARAVSYRPAAVTGSGAGGHEASEHTGAADERCSRLKLNLKG